MKHKILIIFILCSSILTAQNIIKVNNIPGVIDVDYNNVDTAIFYANTNDIIMVYGSPNSYGSIYINKKVKIVGPGYFLTENPQTSITGASAEANNIYFQSGSEGATVEGFLVQNNIEVQTDTINVKRCKIGYDIDLNGNNNIVISECYIGDDVVTGGNNSTSIIVSNSIILDQIWASGAFTISGVFSQNIIKGVESESNLPHSSTYINNIFTNSATTVINNDVGVNTFINNLFTSSAVAYTPDNSVSGNTGNITGVTVSSLFVGTTGNSTDGQYQLKAGSPAIGAGQGGVDCGVFGGTSPYVLSGLPAIPNIHQLTAPLQTNGNGTLPITIKLKANN